MTESLGDVSRGAGALTEPDAHQVEHIVRSRTVHCDGREPERNGWQRVRLWSRNGNYSGVHDVVPCYDTINIIGRIRSDENACDRDDDDDG